MRASAGSISWPARRAAAPIFLTTARSMFPVPHAGSKISPSITGGIIEATMTASSSEVTGAGRAGESAYRPCRSSNTSSCPCSAASAASDLQKRHLAGPQTVGERLPAGHAPLRGVGSDGIRATARQAPRPAGFPVPARNCGRRRERAQLEERQKRGDVGERLGEPPLVAVGAKLLPQPLSRRDRSQLAVGRQPRLDLRE